MLTVFQRKASGDHAQGTGSIVTTCCVVLQLASSSPWTSPSRDHTPAPAQTQLLISQLHLSERTPRDGPICDFVTGVFVVT